MATVNDRESGKIAWKCKGSYCDSPPDCGFLLFLFVNAEGVCGETFFNILHQKFLRGGVGEAFFPKSPPPHKPGILRTPGAYNGRRDSAQSREEKDKARVVCGCPVSLRPAKTPAGLPHGRPPCQKAARRRCAGHICTASHKRRGVCRTRSNGSSRGRR